MDNLKILLVDDNQKFLSSLSRFLSRFPGFEIVGEAYSGREAIQKTVLLTPDLVIMDWIMPEINGLEATERIKELHPEIRVIILTLLNYSNYCDTAEEVGADAIISKDRLGVELMPLLKSLFPEQTNSLHSGKMDLLDADDEF